MILEKHSRVPRKASQIDLPSPAAKEHPELTPQQLGLYQARLKPLSKVSIKQVLDRYLLDEKVSDIAHSLGVSRSALNAWLLRMCPDDWKRVQVARAITRKQNCEEIIDSAPNALALARGRDGERGAQWDLERLRPDLYGSKQEVSHVGSTPVFSVTIVAAEPQRSAPSALIESDAHKDATST